ncbi:MAG: WecB/TagA/CpsF family glycosyltransferase [Ignavibacteria bacterium]|nr:WecB/TagA/CpsF family glycosyltransferase [Ignavibacteria bacterium]
MKNRILNTEITFTVYPVILQMILEKTEKKEKFTVAYANSYLCNYSLKDKSLDECLRKFDLVHADGIAVHIASKFLHKQTERTERVNGTDLYFKLFTGDKSYNYFILGGPEKTKEILGKKFGKNSKICGFLFKPMNQEGDISIINASGADILLVALGTPDQEAWIIKNKDKINVPVIIATGSGIDYLAGVKKRAPNFIRNLGLEWLFRLFQEPARLWNRYIIQNPIFIFKIIKQKVNLIIKKENT